MSKIKLTLVMTMLAMFLFASTAYASGNRYEEEANLLKDLGLFKGGMNGFELERAPKRVEAAIMLIRLLGLEQKVLAGTYPHPFLDVPQWADAYVGYMYENGLTKGVGTDKFGSDDLMDAKSYATFVLRALGYNDALGDFSWGKALEKVAQIGFLENEDLQRLENERFLRDEMVMLSAQALEAKLKDTNVSLIEDLVRKQVVNQNIAITKGLITDYRIFVDVTVDSTRSNVTIDHSSLPKEIRDAVSSIGLNGMSYTPSNPGELVIYGMIGPELIADGDDESEWEPLEEWKHNYRSDCFLVLYSGNKTFGTIYLPYMEANATRKIELKLYDEERYYELITPYMSDIDVMVSEARLLNPEDYLAFYDENNFNRFYLKEDIYNELKPKFVDLEGSVKSFDIESMKDGLLKRITVFGAYSFYNPNGYSNITGRFFGGNEYIDYYKMLFFDKNGKLVAYTGDIIVGAEPQNYMRTVEPLRLELGKAEEVSSDQEVRVFIDEVETFLIKNSLMYDVEGNRINLFIDYEVFKDEAEGQNYALLHMGRIHAPGSVIRLEAVN